VLAPSIAAAVDANKIQPRFKNKVVTVIPPKTAEAQKQSKKIEILSLPNNANAEGEDARSAAIVSDRAAAQTASGAILTRRAMA
jgi:hypothetical protein